MPFARAASMVLAKLGGDSTLDGVPIGPAVVQYGLALDPMVETTADDSTVVRRDVATLPADAEPQVGQTLVHPDGTFILDRKLQDRGHLVRFIVVRS